MRQWIKVTRDLWRTRGRIIFMVFALGAGLATLGGVLSMRAVVQREMNRSYMETVPASATIDLGGKEMSKTTMAELRKHPAVKSAIRMATRSGQWRPGTSTLRSSHTDDVEWGRAKFFVFETFKNRELVKVTTEKGAIEPPLGTALIERSAMSILNADIGDSFEVRTKNGKTTTITISGIVYDPALAPASTEQAGYFYISTKTLALFEKPVLDEVRILVADNPLHLKSVENQIFTISSWLQSRGIEIHEVRIPPPDEHPHQKPSEAVLLLFAIFSGLIVLLSCVLCVSLFTIIMARQTREIAIMKTIGATKKHMIGMYVLFLLIISTMAILLSLFPAIGLARLGIDTVAHLLNFDISSYQTPKWIIVFQFMIGLFLPLFAAMPSIFSAAGASVQSALGNHGAKLENSFLQKWGKPILDLVDDRQIQAGILNALRVPKRTFLTLILLSVGGALFVMAVSVADAWDTTTAQVLKTRHYDVELHLNTPPSTADFKNIKGIKRAEIWGFSPITLASSSGLPLSRTYPDGGHGSFAMVGVPQKTALIDFHLRSGRWLKPIDDKVIVLNQLAAARVGKSPIGQKIDLVVNGKHSTWEIVGIIEEIAAPATAYVSMNGFTSYTGQIPMGLRIATNTKREPIATQQSILDIQRQLTAKGVSIGESITLQTLSNAMGEHVIVLVRALLVLALMMALVGVLALGSSMSTSVLERAREFGVLRAIGANTSQVRKIVLVEGWLISLLSLPLTLLLSIPLAAYVGDVIGQLSFKLDLPLDISWTAMLVWSFSILLVSTFASWMPVRAILNLKTREVLSRV